MLQVWTRDSDSMDDDDDDDDETEMRSLRKTAAGSAGVSRCNLTVPGVGITVTVSPTVRPAVIRRTPTNPLVCIPSSAQRA